MIVTDPPYKCISGGNKKGLSYKHKGSMIEKNDGKIFKYNDIKPEQWIPEIYRILKQNTHCYIMTNVLNMKNFLDIAKKTGFKLHNILVWEKQNCPPNRWYMKNCEYILFFRKGRAKPINNMGSKTVHQFFNPQGNKTHPCEKPIDLLKLYISNSSNEGDIVLDPFCGTGSTLIASKELNRKYIGYELDKEYYDIGIRRLNNLK